VVDALRGCGPTRSAVAASPSTPIRAGLRAGCAPATPRAAATAPPPSVPMKARRSS
jgi:hypothetical protein